MENLKNGQEDAVRFFQETSLFLKTLYGNITEDCYLTIACKSPNISGMPGLGYHICDIDKIIAAINSNYSNNDVYFGMCPMKTPATFKQRGSVDDVAVVPMLWLDLDIAGPNHKSTNYPKNLEEALKFLYTSPVVPTFVNCSGGGLHAFYQLKNHVVIKDDDNAAVMKELSKNFQQYFKTKGAQLGWKIDGTSDLARVLRLPGTLNHKPTKHGLPAQEVFIIEYDPTAIYDIEDIQTFLKQGFNSSKIEEASDVPLFVMDSFQNENLLSKQDYPAYDLEVIETHCEWMEYCRDNAADLTEPEWFAQCSIMAHCENGRVLTHERSKPYPGYNAQETDRKIDGVLKAGPRNCESILSELQTNDFCDGCFFYGRKKSPVSLGITDSLVQAKLRAAKLLFRVSTNPKLVFEEESLETLGLLKYESRGDYVDVLKILKKLGVPKGELKAVLDRYLATSDLLVKDFSPYEVIGNRICVNKPTSNGTKTEILSGFRAIIVEEVEKDDGAESQLFFTIAGQLSTGEQLPEITLSAHEFESMGWVLHRWGAAAWYSGMAGTKEHLRSAITYLSQDIPKRTILAHTGWKKVDGEWVYLNEAGAIGKDGFVDSISVDLSGNNLTDFELPFPDIKLSLKDSARKCLSFLKLASKHIVYPLFSSIFRAPLGEALPITFAIFIVGATGTRKSEISGVAQSYFGKKLNSKNLPCNWSSSANALERITFQTKDLLVVIDDFVPGENPKQMNSIADRVFRGLGNQAGRQRLNADISVRKEYYPRALLLSTGEDVPKGQSLTGRMLLLELAEGDVDLDVLTEFQQLAATGVLAAVMFNYIRWLAPNIDILKAGLPEHKANLRQKAVIAEKTHTRTPDIIADLSIGFESFCSFAISVGAITNDESEILQEECWENLLLAASKQQSQQNEGDQCCRFRDLIKAAFVMGKAHLGAFVSGNPPSDPERWGWKMLQSSHNTLNNGQQSHQTYVPQGTLIGWQDGKYVYLNSDAAFKIAEEVGGRERSITTSAKTLRLRLSERKFLVSGPNGELTIRKRIAGDRRSVMQLFKDFFEDHDSAVADVVTSEDQAKLSFQPKENNYQVPEPTPLKLDEINIQNEDENLEKALQEIDLKKIFFPT